MSKIWPARRWGARIPWCKPRHLWHRLHRSGALQGPGDMAWTQGFPGFSPLGRLLPVALAAASSAACTPCLHCHRLQLGDLLGCTVHAAHPCSAQAPSCACSCGVSAVTGRYVPQVRGTPGERWVVALQGDHGITERLVLEGTLKIT